MRRQRQSSNLRWPRRLRMSRTVAACPSLSRPKSMRCSQGVIVCLGAWGGTVQAGNQSNRARALCAPGRAGAPAALGIWAEHACSIRPGCGPGRNWRTECLARPNARRRTGIAGLLLNSATHHPLNPLQIRTNLLAWYDGNHRILPWRRNPHSAVPDAHVGSAPLDLPTQQFIYWVWVCEVGADGVRERGGGRDVLGVVGGLAPDAQVLCPTHPSHPSSAVSPCRSWRSRPSWTG